MVRIDPVWEEKYAAGHAERYPWDCIVSFVFRNAPRARPHNEIGILEVGSGTGSNLWFCAREGFRVSGIEGSAAGVAKARERFAAEGLRGELRVGDFADPLPFADASFDLAFDRCAITCTGFSVAQRLVREIRGTLRLGGKFFFNPYSRADTSFSSGMLSEDELVANITAGTLTGVGRLCFYDEAMVKAALGEAFAIERFEHQVSSDIAQTPPTIHSEWRVVARAI